MERKQERILPKHLDQLVEENTRSITPNPLNPTPCSVVSHQSISVPIHRHHLRLRYLPFLIGSNPKISSAVTPLTSTSAAPPAPTSAEGTTSPNKKAFLSLLLELFPLGLFLCILTLEDPLFTNVEVVVDREDEELAGPAGRTVADGRGAGIEVSGSSIQAKEDWAIEERAGRRLLGLSGFLGEGTSMGMFESGSREEGVSDEGDDELGACSASESVDILGIGSVVTVAGGDGGCVCASGVASMITSASSPFVPEGPPLTAGVFSGVGSPGISTDESSRQILTTWALATAISIISRLLARSSRTSVVIALSSDRVSSNIPASCLFRLAISFTAESPTAGEANPELKAESLLDDLDKCWRLLSCRFCMFRRISPMASLTAWLMPSFSLLSRTFLAAPWKSASTPPCC